MVFTVNLLPVTSSLGDWRAAKMEVLCRRVANGPLALAVAQGGDGRTGSSRLALAVWCRLDRFGRVDASGRLRGAITAHHDRHRRRLRLLAYLWLTRLLDDARFLPVSTAHAPSRELHPVNLADDGVAGKTYSHTRGDLRAGEPLPPVCG